MSHGNENENLDTPLRASSRFFSLPEIMAITMIHIPVLQLLVIQRTSKTFHNTITSSPTIQRKLFLRPDPHKNAISQINGNLFLQKFGTSWFHTSTARIFGDITTTNLARHDHPRASWRKMLVSMPAAKRLVMTRFDAAKGWGQCAILVAKESREGLRMGQVADHAWEGEEQLSTLIQMEVEM